MTLREAGSDCSCYLEQSQRDSVQGAEQKRSCISTVSTGKAPARVTTSSSTGLSMQARGSARLLSFLCAQRLEQAINPPCAGNAGKGSVRISTLEETCVKLKVITSKSHPGVKVAEPQKLLQSRGADSAKLCKLQG